MVVSLEFIRFLSLIFITNFKYVGVVAEWRIDLDEIIDKVDCKSGVKKCTTALSE